MKKTLLLAAIILSTTCIRPSMGTDEKNKNQEFSVNDLKESFKYWRGVAENALHDINPGSDQENPPKLKDREESANVAQQGLQAFLTDTEASENPVWAYLYVMDILENGIFIAIEKNGDFYIQWCGEKKYTKEEGLLMQKNWEILEQLHPFLFTHMDTLFSQMYEQAYKSQTMKSLPEKRREILNILKERAFKIPGRACEAMYAQALLRDLKIMEECLPLQVKKMTQSVKILEIEKKEAFEHFRLTQKEMIEEYEKNKMNMEVQESLFKEFFENIALSLPRQNIVLDRMLCRISKKNFADDSGILEFFQKEVLKNTPFTEDVFTLLESMEWDKKMILTARAFHKIYVLEYQNETSEKWHQFEEKLTKADFFKKSVIDQFKLNILFNGISIQEKSLASRILGHDTMNLQEREEEYKFLLNKIEKYDPKVKKEDQENSMIAWHTNVLKILSQELQTPQLEKTLRKEYEEKYNQTFSIVSLYATDGHVGAGTYIAQKFKNHTTQKSSLSEIFGDTTLDTQRLHLLFKITQAHKLMKKWKKEKEEIIIN